MPKRGKKRKKRRTHVVEDDEAQEAAPRSFIFKRGKVSENVAALIQDLRKVMSPYTATNLKESRKNKLKDFMSIAGPMGITHLLTFSQTDIGTNMRIVRVPRGPTLVFRVEQYSLRRDVVDMQKRPVSVTTEFNYSPLVVLNNFSGAEKHKQLMAAMFQNMFPPLNIQKIKLTECRRVVLFDYNKEKDFVELRHFLVTAQPVGLRKSVKRIIKAKLPSMAKFQDISDYVLDAGNYTSDSEAEDTHETRVELAQDMGGRGNKKTHKSAIRLKEIGPRVRLSLLKIEEGVNSGRVLYNRFRQKSAKEEAQQEKDVQAKKALKAQRRAEQDANVARKQAIKTEKNARRKARKAAREANGDAADGENSDSDSESGSESEPDSDSPANNKELDEFDRFAADQSDDNDDDNDDQESSHRQKRVRFQDDQDQDQDSDSSS